jgi:hypothetical protein
MTLRSSDSDRAKIVLKGTGAGLNVDTPPLGLPLTAQLVALQTNVCWGAT